MAEPDLPPASLLTAVRVTPAARSGEVHLFHLDDVTWPSFRSRFWGDPERVLPVEELHLQPAVRLYRYAADRWQSR